MTLLNILHVSDLHFSKTLKKDFDQKIVIDAFFTDLRDLKKSHDSTIDLVIFSGDLVQAGDLADDFRHAFDNFISPLLPVAGITLDNFFIVPGNHDISRKALSSPTWMEHGLLNGLHSVDTLNQFLDEYWPVETHTTDPFKRIANYEEFVRSIKKSPLLDTPFVKTYLQDIKGVKVGVACFNSAWRATGAGGTSEKGNLLIGERTVDRAVHSLVPADIKLAVFHHPLSWLNDFDCETIRRRLEAEFAGIFCGHTHVADPAISLTSTGSSFSSQSGSLYSKREYFNGYQLVKLDSEEGTVEFIVREYDDRNRKFFPARTGENGISKFELKKIQAQTQTAEAIQFMAEAKAIVRTKALRHIVLIQDQNANAFHEAFVCPPICEMSEKDAYARGATKAPAKFFPLEDLLVAPENIFIHGKRECGKTSLAYALALRCLEGTTDGKHVAPVIIDFSKLTRVKYKFDQNVRSFYEEHPEAEKILEFLARGEGLIILDNAAFRTDDDLKVLDQIQKLYPGNKWILLLDEGLPIRQDSVEVSEHFGQFLKFYVHSLQRKQIRRFTDRWSERFDLVPGETFTSVMAYIENGDLPRTGYVLSLLLWAISKKKEADRVNEATLIENIIEMLLEKSNFALAAREEFDFGSRVLILRKIAIFLKENGNYAPSNAISEVIINSLKERALPFDATEIFNLFLGCGILSKDSQNTTSFKYISFQEYFVAEEISKNKDLYKDVITKKNFIKYNRELELLTGINRENPELLEMLQSELRAIIPEVVEKQDITSFSQVSQDEEETQQAFVALDKLNNKTVSSEEIDDAVDMAERRMAEKNGGGSGIGKMGTFVGLLSLYGRVIRNLEWNKEADKISHITFFFECWIKLTLAVTQQLKEIIVEWVEKKEIEEKDMPLITNYVCNIFFPIVISFVASEHVGTKKLDSILKKIASNENSDVGLSVFSLFTLLDQKGKDWHVSWKDFLKEKRSHRHAVRLCIEKLTAHLCVFPQSGEDQKKFKELISNTYLSLEGYSKRGKGKLIDHLGTMAKSIDDESGSNS